MALQVLCLTQLTAGMDRGLLEATGASRPER